MEGSTEQRYVFFEYLSNLGYLFILNLSNFFYLHTISGLDLSECICTSGFRLPVDLLKIILWLIQNFL